MVELSFYLSLNFSRLKWQVNLNFTSEFITLGAIFFCLDFYHIDFSCMAIKMVATWGVASVYKCETCICTSATFNNTSDFSCHKFNSVQIASHRTADSTKHYQVIFFCCYCKSIWRFYLNCSVFHRNC